MVTAHTHAPTPSAPAAAPERAHASRTPDARIMNTAPAMRLAPSETPLPSQWVSTPGEPLSSGVRGRLETSFNYDLSPVRVHSDPRAASSADGIGANAFTYGNHIVLGPNQSPSNLNLMAHETTHVIQQQGAPTVQMSSRGDSGGSLEREAQQAGQSVSGGQRVAVAGRTGSKFIQADEKPGWWDRAKSGVKAIGSAIGDVTEAPRKAAIKWFKDKARSFPGYELLGVILGRDPISQEPVERNATNVLRGIAGLIPGGTEVFENVQKSGVIQRAYEWVTGEIDRLNITWAMISGAFTTFINSLGIGDLGNFSGLWERVKAIFGDPVSRLVTFAKSAGRKLMEFILEGALALGGSAAQRVLGIFKKIGATFGLIADDPGKFLGNLLNAVMGGFKLFSSNILTHLKAALFDWLFGALGGAGIKLPQKFDFMGIMSIVLQVLGLTYERLRERLVKLVGEPAVKLIEEGFAFVKILVTQGIAAAWEKILEFATGMVDTVIESIRNWVITTIVKTAVTKLATMFNPLGAIIQMVITIYQTIMFFIEKAKQIADLVEAIVDSVDNIARGNIGAATAYVEKTLARTLPVILGFLARFLNLSGISDTIKDTIKKIRDTVDKAINRIVDWIKEKAVGLVGKAKAGVAAVVGWWKARKTFKTKSGEEHSLFFSGEESSAVLKVASKEQEYRTYIDNVPVGSDPDKKKAKNTALQKLAAIEDLKRRSKKDGSPVEKFDTLLSELSVATITLMSGAGGSGSAPMPESTPPIYGGLSAGGFATNMTINVLSFKGPIGTEPGGLSPTPTWNILQTRHEKPTSRYPFFKRGHLLSWKLHGPGNTWSNITPQSESGNASFERGQGERQIKGWVIDAKEKDRKAVRYSVTALYGGHGTNKSAIIAQWQAANDPQIAKKRAILDAEDKVPTAFRFEYRVIYEDGAFTQNGASVGPLETPNKIRQEADAYNVK